MLLPIKTKEKEIIASGLSLTISTLFISADLICSGVPSFDFLSMSTDRSAECVVTSNKPSDSYESPVSNSLQLSYNLNPTTASGTSGASTSMMSLPLSYTILEEK